MQEGFVSAGKRFTDRYLAVMFASLRDATPEEVQQELEHCRHMNKKPVRVPKLFRGSFSETSFEASNGYQMQVFSTEPYHEDDTLILYLHGGACIYQPVFFHWRFTHDIALRTHYRLVMPIYPKYPEYHCVDNMTVLLDFYERWVMRQGFQRIILMGDSFGGNVAMGLCQEIAHRGWQPVSDLVLLSPCVDNAFTRRDQMKALQHLDIMIKRDRVETIMGGWRGELPATHPWVSPVYGDLTTFPKNTLLIYGSNEILKVDAEMLVEKMQALGQPIHASEYEGMFHTFPMFPVKEGFMAIKEMVKGMRNAEFGMRN
ncbi:MAG: alpha/beta hydrolase fold domain-containing protein [Bacteroidales bacterium]|nr:alpha/beta hydrolase fold domain-containing protein [Bacteroidales bacterium]